MGIMANYMIVDEDNLKKIMEIEDEDELINELDELEDSGIELYCMDKLWDGLHFLLTGVSASEPIENDRLSESIVGVDVFDEEAEAFIACIQHGDLIEIVAKMKEIKVEILAAEANLANFRKKKIYPKIWQDKDKDVLMEELINEFKNLTNFYEKAIENKGNIIISIY